MIDSPTGRDLRLHVQVDGPKITLLIGTAVTGKADLAY